MSFSLLPSFKFKSVTDIDPAFLKEKGITLLLLDLDNTLSPYRTTKAESHITDWVNGLKDAGVRLFIVSNNRGDRPEIFSRALGLEYIKKAKKPSPAGVRRAMELLGARRDETALVGDQIYTDMIAASLAGISGILVEPIRFTNIFLAVRYFAELPFRRATGKKRAE